MASDGNRAGQNDVQGWVDREAARSLALAVHNPKPMPKVRVAGHCPKETIFRSSCKGPNCPVCGPRWARDQQRRLAINLEHAGVKVATIAITGPGADVLPWDEEWCKHRQGHSHRREHKHSGSRGCRVQQRPLREWCELLPWRWKNLRNTVRNEMKRKHKTEPPWMLCRVWEPQKRGVPHLHIVVPYGTFEERRAANLFRTILAREAPEYGFGRVQPKLNAIEGKEAARYLANYLAGRTGKKSSIRENIGDPRLPKALVWLTPILSSVSESPRMVKLRAARGVRLGTGVTMRTMRRARHLWACFAGVCDAYPRWRDLEEAMIVALVFRSIYPKRAGPAGDVDEALGYARDVDRHVRRTQGLRGWDRELYDERTREYVTNEPLMRQMTEIAFVATRAPLAMAA